MKYNNKEYATLSEMVEDSNKAFKKANKQRKKVLLAKDVLLRMEIHNITIDKGRFLRYSSKYAPFIEQLEDTSLKDIQLQDFFNQETSYTPVCTVCAKGALFCAYVGRMNEVTARDLDNGDNNSRIDSINHKKLLKLFTPEELDSIEIAFEGFSHLKILYHNYQDKEKVAEGKSLYIAAIKFYEAHFDNAKERMIAICNNIIKNKGTFKP